jgi:protein SCO1/2
MKNKSYIGTSLIILIFGIIFIPKIVNRIKNGEISKADRLNKVQEEGTGKSDLQTIGKAPSFSLTDQNGKTISNNDYNGKVYVVEFFFSTCPTICPMMTDNMVWLQEKIKNNPKVLLLSHSVTPDIDSVPVLKAYAQKKGVVDSKWNLVTGDKKEIYGIARKSYLAVKTGSPDELYDMVHTENFILVDQKRRVRGFYDGTKAEDIQRLIEDINWLSQNEN